MLPCGPLADGWIVFKGTDVEALFLTVGRGFVVLGDAFVVVDGRAGPDKCFVGDFVGDYG